MFDKLNQAALEAAAKATGALAAAGTRKTAVAAVPAAAMGVLAGAPAAFADGTSNAINTIFDKINNEALQPFYTGLLSVIGIVALIFLIKELIQGATSSAGAQRSSHVSQCLVILVICIIMGFAPTIIKWVLAFGDAGMTVNLPGKSS